MDLKYTPRSLGLLCCGGRSMTVFVCWGGAHTSGSWRRLSAPRELAAGFSLTECVLWATFECQEWQLGGWAAVSGPSLTSLYKSRRLD